MRVQRMIRLVGFGLLAMLPTASGQPSTSCTANSECARLNCCRLIGFCSATNQETLLFGEAASDACECVSGILDSSGALCGITPYGVEPEVDNVKSVFCVFNYTCDTQFDVTPQGCADSDDCTGDTCCMATGDCSTEVEGSVTGGTAAEDVCECNSNQYDDVTLLCGCNRDNQCRGQKCCVLDDNTCSEGPEADILTGEAALDICECASGVYDPDQDLCGCASDDECDIDNGEICCPEKDQCEVALESDAAACGDPHMTGFHGQKFDFTGEDGAWYALISDLPSVHINMRVTAPVPSLPEITYITGLSVLTTDADGFEHSMVISVKDPHSLDSACPTEGSVCLADGALNVVFDGEEELVAPGTTLLAPSVEVTAANIPGECRSFGFEQYWERKKLEYAQADRRLRETENMGDWILGDPTVTNMAECVEYVAGAMMDGNALFDHQSEHVSFRIVTPTTTIRLSHGRLHQLAMRDPTDQYDLPDHLTWQMNMAIDHSDISHDAQGIIGETFVPTRDANGDIIMHGMECIRGEQEDYYVNGPLGISFAQVTFD